MDGILLHIIACCISSSISINVIKKLMRHGPEEKENVKGDRVNDYNIASFGLSVVFVRARIIIISGVDSGSLRIAFADKALAS